MLKGTPKSLLTQICIENFYFWEFGHLSKFSEEEEEEMSIKSRLNKGQVLEATKKYNY